MVYNGKSFGLLAEKKYAESEDKNEQNFKNHLHKAFLLWYTLNVNVGTISTKVFAKKV